MASWAQSVVNSYQDYFSDSTANFEEIGVLCKPFPRYTEHVLNGICDVAILNFQKQPSLLHLNGDFTIVGDLHGNIRDLLRILANGGCPSRNKILFLGDYVDRGDFGVEVITLLFSLSIVYPNNVFLIRGNHEIAEVNSQYGFRDQVKSEYSDALWGKFNDVFSYLPFAAEINGDTFCVHGGLSPMLRTVDEIEKIKRPLISPAQDQENAQLISDILWSDPSCAVPLFIPSLRGNGCLFGILAVRSFLVENNFQRIIRAHQHNKNGVSLFADGKLMTVFSSSNYKPDLDNMCGVLKIPEQGEIQAFNLEPLPVLTRMDSSFRFVDPDNEPVLRNQKTLKSIKVIHPLIEKMCGAKRMSHSITSIAKGSSRISRTNSFKCVGSLPTYNSLKSHLKK